VHDRAAFAAVIAEAITSDHRGRRNAAAKSVGVPHNTLRRYHSQLGSAVRLETLQRLRSLVGAGREPRLNAALIGPLAQQALQRYEAWVRAEIESIGVGPLRVRALHTAVHEDHLALEIAHGDAWDRMREADRLVSRMKRRFPRAWAPLNRCVAGRHFGPRKTLAYFRVVGPLLHADESRLRIERRWEELTERDLERFISAGVVREAILLKRESNERRAQDDEITIPP
jgi:hypothetical protein